MTRVFVDTNVLVYAVDAGEPVKRDIARGLLDEFARSGEMVISTQVLKEFYNIAVRKLDLESQFAERCVREFARNETIETSVEIILGAIVLHRSHPLSFWDALIVQSAIKANCTQLLSEDMQNGSRFDDLVVSNPFAA